MPSVSKSQQRLFQAAEHGASFPKAQKLRDALTHQQLHDFSVGSEKGKPERVQAPKKRAPSGPRMAGSHDGLTITNHHRIR